MCCATTYANLNKYAWKPKEHFPSPQSFSTGTLFPRNVTGPWGRHHHLRSSASRVICSFLLSQTLKLWLKIGKSEKAAAEHEDQFGSAVGRPASTTWMAEGTEEDTALVTATEGPRYTQKTLQTSAGKC